MAVNYLGMEEVEESGSGFQPDEINSFFFFLLYMVCCVRQRVANILSSSSVTTAVGRE